MERGCWEEKEGRVRQRRERMSGRWKEVTVQGGREREEERKKETEERGRFVFN